MHPLNIALMVMSIVALVLTSYYWGKEESIIGLFWNLAMSIVYVVLTIATLAPS